jgi:type VII secretion integral membrane protein EccD
MAATAASNLCRLTVMTTQTRLDLAVPLDLSVSELMTTLVRTLGPQVADQGAAAGGFVLQRAAEAPLDPSVTLRDSEIRDGDVLHMRMRAAQMPEVAYDDVLDAVATGVLTRSVRWTSAHTARACMVGASAMVAFVVLTCLLTGPGWAVPAAVSGGLALLLVGAAATLDRGYQQHGAALTAAAWAIVCGACSGAMVVGGDDRPWQFDATQVLPAGAAAVLVAVLCLVLLTRGVPGFVAVTGFGVLAAIGATVADVGDFHVAGTAAFTAGIALLVSPVIPVTAFKLSRLSLPFVPTSADDLRSDRSTIDGSRVLGQAARADQFMTGIVVALAAVLGGAAVLLSASGGTVAEILAAVLVGICLLRARLFTGRSQRMSMLAAGAVAAVAVLVDLAAATSGTTRLLAVAVPVCLLSIGLLALVTVLPGRRYAPPSGRTADLVESLLVLSVLPLILGVIGVYGRIYNLTS